MEQYLYDQVPELEIESHPLRGWQTTLVEVLKVPPSPREIIFVVDKKGNAIKSWFAKYYQQVYGEYLCLIPSRKVDMIYAIYSSLKQYKVYFIDIARSKMDSDGPDYASGSPLGQLGLGFGKFRSRSGNARSGKIK